MKKLFVLAVLSLPVLAQAQGFQVNLQGQRQQGMGGTGTGLVTDGAALFFNPGSASFLTQNSVSAGATAAISGVTYADATTGATYNTESPIGFPFTGYAVFGKKHKSLKYGLAAYTPFGSTVIWQDGWAGRFVSTKMQLASVFVQPTLSYKVSEKLGIGAGFVYAIGKANLKSDLPVADANNTYGQASLSGRGNGIGFNAGLYFQPTAQWSFGLSYRSKVEMKLDKGQATFTVPASLAGSFPSGPFSAQLPLPATATAGIGFKPSKKVSLAFEASQVAWHVLDSIVFDFETNTKSLGDMRSDRNYKNAYAYRLGAEYAVTKKFQARAGVKYLITPVQDGYLSPDVPDATHFNYSAGLGYRVGKHWVFDASFTFQQMERSGTQQHSGLSGTYKTVIYMPGFSINYNF